MTKRALSMETKIKLPISSCLAFVIFAGNASAYDLDYELRIGAGHTDNVARAETFTIDETLAIAGVQIDFSRLSSGVDLTVIGDLEYRHYADGTFDDDTWGSITSNALFRISPRFLEWVADHRFGHIVRDPFEAENPFTRERVNSLGTGPNLTIPLGPSNSLGLNGRYRKNDYERANIDHDLVSGTLSFARAFSRNRSVSLDVASTDVKFDDSIFNTDFERRSAFIEFDSQNSKGSIVLRVGVNELEQLGQERDGKLFELTLDRLISSRTNLQIELSQQLTFAGELFNNRQGPGQALQDTRNIAGVADPLEIRRIEAGIRRTGSTAGFFFSVAGQNDEFVNVFQLDRTTLSARIGGNRQLGSNWQVSIGATVGRVDFENDPRSDDNLSITIGIQRQLSRSVGLRLDLTHNDRSSNGFGTSYTENVGFLTLRYRP